MFIERFKTNLYEKAFHKEKKCFKLHRNFITIQVLFYFLWINILSFENTEFFISEVYRIIIVLKPQIVYGQQKIFIIAVLHYINQESL